jgi:Amt family ammonium transporter
LGRSGHLAVTCFIGTLATGVFAYGPLTATPESPGAVIVGRAALLLTLATAVAATMLYAGLMSWGLPTITERLIGLRVTGDDEREGLDIALHGEQVF